MSTVINDQEKNKQLRAMSDNNNNRDIGRLHQNIIKSFEESKLRQQSRDNLEQSWLPYRQSLKFISQLTHIPSDILNNYARTYFFLMILGLLFPLNLFITLFTLLFSYLMGILQHKQPASNPNSKRILISGGMMTKSLQLCRSFYQAGHQIVLIDESINWLTGHRWSNSVERFYVHPSPIEEPDAYISTLANIVRKEKIDIFMPVNRSYHIHIEAQIKSALAVHGCSVFPADVDEITLVNSKYAFINKARSLHLTVPKSILITSRQQLLDFDFDTEHCPYICKSNSFDRKVTTKLPRSTRAETIECINSLVINEECSYILQEFIQGEEYCTHGTCMDGELTLFTCCQSSSSQVNYKHIEHPDILEWCTQYVRALKLTGHLSMDFIVSDKDKKAYAITCDPSVHSAITVFYNHANVADAYYLPGLSSPIVPLSTARQIYWLPHELWSIFRNIRSIKKSVQSLKTIFYGKEAIWSLDDPFPFLLHYHIHIFYLLFHNLFSKHARFFNKIDCCTGKLA